jgi:hypothetical protein
MATLQIQNSQIPIADALWALIQSQPKKVQQAIAKKFKEEDVETERQKSFVKETLSQSLKELEMAQEGKIQLEDARNLFK